MACGHRPEHRYALNGEFTHKGVQIAEEYLRDLYLDHHAITRHHDAVDAACRQARQELEQVGHDFAPQRQPLEEQCRALRREHRAGGMQQKAYQLRLADLRQLLADLHRAEEEAKAAVQASFLRWMRMHCDRAVTLADAEAFLTMPAGIAWPLAAERSER